MVKIMDIVHAAGQLIGRKNTEVRNVPFSVLKGGPAGVYEAGNEEINENNEARDKANMKRIGFVDHMLGGYKVKGNPYEIFIKMIQSERENFVTPLRICDRIDLLKSERFNRRSKEHSIAEQEFSPKELAAIFEQYFETYRGDRFSSADKMDKSIPISWAQERVNAYQERVDQAVSEVKKLQAAKKLEQDTKKHEQNMRDRKYRYMYATCYLDAQMDLIIQKGGRGSGQHRQVFEVKSLLSSTYHTKDKMEVSWITEQMLNVLPDATKWTEYRE